jgi:FKBP-type peptidyl-prolyl cis-trans isomerase FklB
MKFSATIALGIVVLFSVCHAGDKPDLKDLMDRESYSLGYQFGQSLKAQGVDIDLDIYAAGIRDSLGGKEPRMSPEEIRATVANLRQRVAGVQQKALKEQADKNYRDGEDFLVENARKEGVKSLPSGLQYKVLRAGSGRAPKAADTVTVHYRGTFINGTEFDSSITRGQPQTFKVDGVIPGWTEALQLMKEGDKWQIFVPANLAYGEKGAPPRIPPNSALIFEVELISVQQSG